MNRDEGTPWAFMVGIIMAVVLVLVAIPAAWWFFRVENADMIGRGNAEIQIESANNRIPSYEHFYDLCVSVQNAEEGLNAEYDRLSRTEDAREKQIIETNISALRVTRAKGINQYNADSSKYYTDARFKGYNLPDRLSNDPFEKGGPITQCAS